MIIEGKSEKMGTPGPPEMQEAKTMRKKQG
jgi:hypothetical protein